MLYDDAFTARLHAGLRRALPAWGFGPDTALTLLTVSENATFVATQPDGRRFVLRVGRPGYHDAAEVRSELDWIGALRAAHTIDTPAPVPCRNGAPVHCFDDGGEPRLVTCFEHVAGTAPDDSRPAPDRFRTLGALAARMHAQSRSFRRPPGFRRKSWTWDTIIGPAARWGDWRAAPGLSQADRALLERAAGQLRHDTDAFGTAPDRFGLIHGDMRAANLIEGQDGRLWVIDFDDCGLCWFGYDFAASVSFIEDDPRLPDLMRAWIAGYRSVAPLSEAGAARLPMFVMLRRMQLTAWLASHAETPTARMLAPRYGAGTVALARDWLSTRAAR